MLTIARHWSRQSLILAAAAVALAGCGDEFPLGPDGRSASSAPVAATVSSDIAGGVPDLGTCDSLRAPAGSKLFYHVYAEGAQIYRWSGSDWGFVAPSASLFADAGGKATVGTHYRGPTWQSANGGKVVGALNKGCPMDPAAIPWLLLDVVSDSGGGVFQGAKYIQRVNTVGGKIPTVPGGAPGELKEVPYTAEYFFYRAP